MILKFNFSNFTVVAVIFEHFILDLVFPQDFLC